MRMLRGMWPRLWTTGAASVECYHVHNFVYTPVTG